MTDYENEKDEIVNYVNVKFDEKRSQKDLWKKWKGNFCAGVIKKHMQKRLDEGGVEVVGPNVYIERFPTEWDLLVVRKNAEIVDEAPTYKINDVRHAIEVKSSLIKENDKNRGIEKYLENRNKIEETGIKCSIVQILYSRNIKSISDKLPDEYFCLSLEKNWENFINRVKNFL